MFFKYLREGCDNVDSNIVLRIYYCSDLTTYIREMNILNSIESINEIKYIIKPTMYKIQYTEITDIEKYKDYKV